MYIYIFKASTDAFAQPHWKILEARFQIFLLLNIHVVISYELFDDILETQMSLRPSRPPWSQISPRAVLTCEFVETLPLRCLHAV